MGLSQQLGQAVGGFGKGILQGVVAWLYSKLFAEEIATQEAKEKALLDKVAVLQTKVDAAIKADQQQIDDATKEKQPIQDAIKVEQQRQQDDEAGIAKVKADEQKAKDIIVNRPDSDVLRDDF